jgi:hypothetical protein
MLVAAKQLTAKHDVLLLSMHDGMCRKPFMLNLCQQRSSVQIRRVDTVASIKGCLGIIRV